MENKTLKDGPNYVEEPVDPGSGGYSYVKSLYSSAWGEWGSLYKLKSVTEDKYYGGLNFSAGTFVSTVLAVVDIVVTKGGLTAIFRSLLYTFTGSTLDTVFSGSIDARRVKNWYKVYSQGELGLKTYKYTVEAVIRDSYGNVAYPEVADGGDARTENEIIHAGIYNVVMWNL